MPLKYGPWAVLKIVINLIMLPLFLSASLTHAHSSLPNQGVIKADYDSSLQLAQTWAARDVDQNGPTLNKDHRHQRQQQRDIPGDGGCYNGEEILEDVLLVDNAEHVVPRFFRCVPVFMTPSLSPQADCNQLRRPPRV